jgi:chaperonin cofactor prefoldin
MILDPILIQSTCAGFIGMIIGLLISKKPKSKSSVLNNSGDDLKLKNEVLRDQVKQLESKVKTLERALEITSKN